MVNYIVKFSGSLRMMFGIEVLISVDSEITIGELLKILIKKNKQFEKYVKYEENNIISPLILVDGKKVKREYLIGNKQKIFIIRRSLGG
jgi:hypothetical protein